MSTCIRCKQYKDLSSFWNNKIYSYCKICSKEYLFDNHGSYPEQYILLKSKNQPITCNCGKTITKPYWYKNHHLKSKYHNKHIQYKNIS